MASSKNRYQKTFSLILRQPWLGEHEDRVYSLFEECETDDQVDLVIELLRGFTYVDQAQEKALLDQIVADVISLGVEESELQIVALSANDDPDSSQVIIYALKPAFAKAGWRNVQLVNQFSKAQRYATERRHVCFVDEFVGTGRTLIGRTKALIRDFAANKGVKDAKFRVFSYAGMHDAGALLRDSGLFESVKFYRILTKGITQRSDDPATSLLLMNALESKLRSVINGFQLPKLGDGACEALYGREGGNCPNSVFPVFWWPETSDEVARNTLLTRRF